MSSLSTIFEAVLQNNVTVQNGSVIISSFSEMRTASRPFLSFLFVLLLLLSFYSPYASSSTTFSSSSPLKILSQHSIGKGKDEEEDGKGEEKEKEVIFTTATEPDLCLMSPPPSLFPPPPPPPSPEPDYTSSKAKGNAEEKEKFNRPQVFEKKSCIHSSKDNVRSFLFSFYLCFLFFVF